MTPPQPVCPRPEETVKGTGRVSTVAVAGAGVELAGVLGAGEPGVEEATDSVQIIAPLKKAW
jgi:hypothetical protein